MKKLMYLLLITTYLASCDSTSSQSLSEVAPSSEEVSTSIAPSSEESSSMITTSNDSTSAEPSYENQLYLNSNAWGLGSDITTYVSNDQDYDWYVDQYTTGQFWNSNCGPTSIEMVGRFYSQSFAYTAEDARANFRPSGGWWYDIDIASALDYFEIPHSVSTISSSHDLIDLLDTGGVVLVNPDMSRVNQEVKSSHHTGLFYTSVTGHYLVVKGYVIVDGNTFFEVHDPWSLNLRYANGELKGKNRYYDETSFLNSILYWWPRVYTVEKASSI